MSASKSTKAAYFNYIGSIELPEEIILMCPMSGSADQAINEMRQLPEVVAELSEIDPVKLIEELREFGAWGLDELADHNENLNRILWIACLNIQEENSLFL